MFIGMLISCLLRWNQQLRWLEEFLMCIIGPPYYGGSYKITIVSLSVRLSDFLHDGIVTFVNIVMKFFFWHADKLRSFLQVDTIILGVRSQVYPEYPQWQVSNIVAISRENEKDEVDFFPVHKQGFFKLIPSFEMCVSRHIQITQTNKFAISLQYVKKEVSDEVNFVNFEVNFCMQISMKVSCKLILWFLMEMVKHSQSSQKSCLCNISKKNLVMKFNFLHAVQYQSFLQFDSIQYFVHQSFLQGDAIILVGMIKHS